MVQQKCQEENTNSESPLQGGNEPQGVKMSVENSKANGEGLNRQNQKMTLKPVPTSGRFKVILSVVITANLEFNSMCRRKKHSLLHWNTLMLPGPLILIWTSCKKSVLMTAGISIRTEVRQILGKDSQNALNWKKNLPKDVCGPVRDWPKFKRLRDQIMYGLKYGAKLGKPLRIEKNKNGKTRNQNSTKLDDWEESTLLIRMTKNTRKLSKYVDKTGKAHGRGHAVQKEIQF